MGKTAMMEFSSFAAFAAHLEKLAAIQKEVDKGILNRVTKFLQKKVKAKFGEYQPTSGQFVAWAELADSTKADRVRQGYSENEPLLRDGTLRSEVERSYDHEQGSVGSNDDVAIYQELGTQHIPPRSVFGSTAVENLKTIREMVAQAAVMALIGKDVFKGRIEIDDEAATPLPMPAEVGE